MGSFRQIAPSLLLIGLLAAGCARFDGDTASQSGPDIPVSDHNGDTAPATPSGSTGSVAGLGMAVITVRNTAGERWR